MFTIQFLIIWNLVHNIPIEFLIKFILTVLTIDTSDKAEVDGDQGKESHSSLIKDESLKCGQER